MNRLVEAKTARADAKRIRKARKWVLKAKETRFGQKRSLVYLRKDGWDIQSIRVVIGNCYRKCRSAGSSSSFPILVGMAKTKSKSKVIRTEIVSICYVIRLKLVIQS